MGPVCGCFSKQTCNELQSRYVCRKVELSTFLILLLIHHHHLLLLHLLLLLLTHRHVLLIFIFIHFHFLHHFLQILLLSDCLLHILFRVLNCTLNALYPCTEVVC